MRTWRRLGVAAMAAALVLAGHQAQAVDTGGAPAAASPQVVPLRGPVPDWFTPELAAAVDTADGQPVAAPTDAPLPSTVGIRPGAWMIRPHRCTMNFVFRNGGDLGIGTAGHCTDDVGQEVTLLTLTPDTGDPVLVEVGTVVARDDGKDDEVRPDFALVEIRSGLHPWVSGTTAVVGGPCGQYGGSAAVPVLHYGHGLAIGTGGTPRAGLALDYDGGVYYWAGTAVFGDSGSPVRVADLPAIGNLTHLVVDPRRPGATAAGTRIGAMLRIAGGGWSLVDSPLCTAAGGGDGGGGDNEPPGNGGGGNGGGGNGGGNDKDGPDRGNGPKK